MYKAKSSAKRAGNKALATAPKGSTLEFFEARDQFGFRIAAPKKDGVEILRVSVVGSPCQLVWDIAEQMEGEKRKVIIEACVAKGIAYYTARTQYQRYREALKAMDKPKQLATA